MSAMKTSDDKKRILLINPKQDLKHYSTQIGMVRMLGKKNSMPSLALAIVAALTPKGYDITVIDEEVEDVDFSFNADIVGITSLSNTIDRAFDMADEFRKRGITVVMGGPHASYSAKECLDHSDSVIIGEAEGLWEKFINDYETGRTKKIYRRSGAFAFTDNVIPRWDLFKLEYYLALPMQATRGCPYDCEFCLVTNMFGKKLRRRSIDDLVSELKSLPMKRVFFVDDNLTIHKKFARELSAALRPHGIFWSCQSSIDIGRYPALLDDMAEAGCEQILIGFESLNTASLKETGKYHNIMSDYEASIANIHSRGIHILASFIVGFDSDGPEEFDRIREFTEKMALPYVALNILGQTPGTKLYERLKREKRIVDGPSEYRGGMFPSLKYGRMSQSDLFAYYIDCIRMMFSWNTIAKKGERLFSTGWFNRPKKDADVKAFEKFIMTIRLVKWYVFTMNSHKRSLFIFLVKLFRNGTMAVERAVIFLLTMEGFHRYVSELYSRKEEFLKVIGNYEKKSVKK
jgi:radical SAM superfamily enzyme YgiQ (UPF0313 family)